MTLDEIPDLERKRSLFWAKVDRGPSCWLWTGGTRSNGYGAFNAGIMVIGAHRFSYLLAHGLVPDALYVCHHCDMPLCVRPDHLFLGTADDNNKDAARKGRMASGACNGSVKYPERRVRGDDHFLRKEPSRVKRGEDSPTAILTATAVQQIRRLYAAGGVRQIDLATSFGVSEMTINKALRRLTWAHISE